MQRVNLLLLTAILSVSCSRPAYVQEPSPIAQRPLVAHPESAVAEAIPAGVAAPDGQLVFVSSPRGIDALEVATGATAWSTGEASVPVLVLPDALLAIRGEASVDAWRGPGALVAIDLAAPHAAHAGPPFELPYQTQTLSSVHVDRGVLIAAWNSAADKGSPLLQSPPDLTGSLRIDLASGVATIAESSPIPEVVSQALVGVTQWLPIWRTRNGWSALPLGGSPGAQSMTLSHWPDAGEPRSIALVDGVDLRDMPVLGATAGYAFVRVCSAPEHCELRAYDSETGEQAGVFVDPIHAGLGPPFALVGANLLGVEGAHRLGEERAIVAIDAATGAPRWRHPIAPLPLPDLRPATARFAE